MTDYFMVDFMSFFLRSPVSLYVNFFALIGNLFLFLFENRDRERYQNMILNLHYIVSDISWKKSGGAHVSILLFESRSAVYHAYFRFHMILMHDQQNPLTTSNYILYAPKPSCNIQHAKIHEITMIKRNLKRWYS